MGQLATDSPFACSVGVIQDACVTQFVEVGHYAVKKRTRTSSTPHSDRNLTRGEDSFQTSTLAFLTTS